MGLTRKELDKVYEEIKSHYRRKNRDKDIVEGIEPVRREKQSKIPPIPESRRPGYILSSRVWRRLVLPQGNQACLRFYAIYF